MRTMHVCASQSVLTCIRGRLVRMVLCAERQRWPYHRQYAARSTEDRNIQEEPDQIVVRYVVESRKDSGMPGEQSPRGMKASRCRRGVVKQSNPR